MNSDDLSDFAETVNSRESFLKFLNHLMENYKNHKDEWDNSRLEDFLEGFLGFTTDIQGYYDNSNQKVDVEVITWKMLTDMLTAAIVYD